MTKKQPVVHLNIGGPRGWTTACGIESASFVDVHQTEEYGDVNCKRCRRAMPVHVRKGRWSK